MTTKELNQFNKLMNGNASDFWSAILQLLSPSLYFKLIQDKFKNLNLQSPNTGNSVSQIEFTVDIYKHKNQHVTKLKNYIEKHLHDECYATILHGSVATNELIGYSDLDAIIILKDEVFNDNKKLSSVAYHLYSSRKYMHELDPLQHHGWLVIPESFLCEFNTSILPVSLLKKSNLLTGNSQFNLSTIKKCPTFKLNSILENLENKISKKQIPTNMFSLKSMLSEFMLTPSLYLQERYNSDVTKKDSFEIASKDFDFEIYSIMNEASEIRQKWHYHPGVLRSYLLKKLRLLPGGSLGFISGKTTSELRDVINLEFMIRMRCLIENMVNLVDNQKKQE